MQNIKLKFMNKIYCGNLKQKNCGQRRLGLELTDGIGIVLLCKTWKYQAPFSSVSI